MDKSEHRLTLEEASDSLAADVMAAMKRAQRAAARENARYGMSLILEKDRKPVRRKVSKKPTARRPSTPAASP